MKKLILALLLLIYYSSAEAQVNVVNAFPNLSFSSPTFLTNSGDGTNRIFVVEKGGFIRVFSNDSTVSSYTTFLDVSNLISNNYTEKGLLGLAFHPNYSSNRYFFIYYTRLSDGALTIARFTTQVGNPNKADSLSQLVFLTIPHPTNLNHDGGNLMFGLDGYLYSGHGDGGGAGDVPNNAQNVNILLGKITRIDVNTPSGGNNYSIPPTNPFASGGGSPEIFAWGMRNPWRFSQDPVTGIIYCGDVGQNVWEEIDTLAVGKNYGWRCYEANHTYNTSGCGSSSLYTFPIKEYPHTSSRCSITGGYVYRGNRVPWLVGYYVYGDYCGMQVYRLHYANGVVSSDSAQIGTSPQSILSFGRDQNNEVYLCGTSAIYRFQNTLIGIDPGNVGEAQGYTLSQNYPNPFNPATVINYTIGKNEFVTLKIYNVQGKEVQTLVSESKPAGNYKVTWDATAFPSGVYFCKVTAGEFSSEKKMVLVK
jgi:glucose/arabinose dehydrogenase